MNARNLLIPLLCVGAVAFACGPRSHSEASLVTANFAKEKTPATVAVSRPVIRKQTRSNTPHVTSSFDVHVEKSIVRFALDLTNASKKNLELTFNDGQAYEFRVIDSAGKEVYRWGEGRMFTQSVQNKVLDSGETMHIAEQAETTLPQGSYVALATLRSSNYPVQERIPFELR
jgi:hypothetical protein